MNEIILLRLLRSHLPYLRGGVEWQDFKLSL